MRFLRKILVVLVLIIVLALLKPVLQKHFPDSNSFHFNLLSVGQMLLLFWAVFTGLLERLVWKNLRPAAARVRSLFVFCALFAAVEATAGWLLFHPRHIPDTCLTAFRRYYDNYDRDIPQFNKKFARYDPGLFYTLRPNNRSLFTNIEFSDSIITDSLGCRTGDRPTDRAAQPANKPADQATSRADQAPDQAGQAEIFCLGDSYTFGWGVQQKEGFPALLQNILHEKVLNTGVPSYGTARELTSIKPLDKKNVSAIVIQYCYNDAEENDTCVHNNFQPVISSAATYDSAVRRVWWSQRWFPGKYSCTLLKLLADDKLTFLHHRPPAPGHDLENIDKEAENFLLLLGRSGLDFDRVHIYVFDIGEYATLTGRFLTAVEKKLATPEYSAQFRQHVHTIHIENLLTPDDYYVPDSHIKPSGHKKIARILADSIQANQPIQATQTIKMTQPIQAIQKARH